MKLGIGTAQFGMDYGVSNCAGQTPADEVAAILEAALTAGVRVLDTAAAYGAAERVLGATRLLESFDVVTKTPGLGDFPAKQRADELERNLITSCERLGIAGVYGLLLHTASDLFEEAGEDVAERLMHLREQGLVSRIGVSVYSPQDLARAMDVLDVDLIQLPLNIYDQRFLADGLLARLVERGIEVHTRSALLQGLLTMDADALPAGLSRFSPLHARYLRSVEDSGSTRVASALGFALGVDEVSAVIVGVNNLEQFHELIHVRPLDTKTFARLASSDLDLIDPSRWR